MHPSLVERAAAARYGIDVCWQLVAVLLQQKWRPCGLLMLCIRLG